MMLLVEHVSVENSGDISGDERGGVKTDGDIIGGTCLLCKQW